MEKRSRKSDEELDFKSLPGSLAHLGAYDNFTKIEQFLTTFALCVSFCIKDKKAFETYIHTFTEEFHQDEIQRFKDKPEVLNEIYSTYYPYSEIRESFLFEIVFCKLVDCFFEYLKDLLSIVVLSQASDANFKKEFSIQEILAHKSPLSLVETVMEDEIKKISYGKKKDLDRLLRQFSLDSVLTGNQKAQLEKYITLRNEITHAKGMRYLYITQKRSTKQHEMREKKLEKAMSNMWNYIDKLDKAANRQFNLEVGNKWLLLRDKKRPYTRKN